MKKFSFLMAGCLLATTGIFSQGGEAPNYSNSSLLPPTAAQSDKMMSNPVNLYTGVPNISIPVYSYKSNSGISMAISIDYAGGGIQVGESPSIVGLGWYLNSGGMISRTVRGMPDDMPTNGYLYAGAIPADWRNDANKYYHDSIDAQQDIFQFNFPGHSGRFFIGKNGQVVVVPSAKIKVIPTFQTATAYNQTLKSFRIIAEDGVKYDFEDADQTTVNIDNSYFPPGFSSTPSGYYGKPHATSWSLTRIISPFNNDTIKYNYQGVSNGEYHYKLPQITFVNNANGARTNPTNAPGYGSSGFRKPSSIELPDKTIVSFIYSYETKYSDNDYVLSKIKISDTAFRFGYLLEYMDTVVTYGGNNGNHPYYNPVRIVLKSITPFTAKEKQEGYKFEYNSPLLPRVGGTNDSIQNQKDFWGYWNAKPNGDSSIPKINSYTWGADRTPTYSALAGSLVKFYLPTGGMIQYSYQLNDHYPYTKQSNTVSIQAQNSTQNNITLNQVLSSKHQLAFFLDKSVARTGSAPVSGSGNLNLVIKSTDGTITYASSSISLYDLFYSGLKTWSFNLNNGTYRLETSLSAGTSITGTFPVDITWENKNIDNTVTYKQSGGLRVATISRSNTGSGYDGSYEVYKYITADGKSSGFLGETPRYDYPFRQIVDYNGKTTTDYTAVCSEPLGTAGYAQIGYNRVEIIRNANSGNLGKEVHEFTDLRDVNTNTFNYAFPYTPQDLRSWGLGLPKRVSVYDSTGVLVKRTVNAYQVDTVVYNNNNFKSVKLGHSQNTLYGNPNNPPVPRVKTFIGDDYYLSSGRVYLTGSTDTIYQTNGSINTSWQNLVYDTNYNVIKVSTSYDRNRGLQKEERMYYPYNYTIGGGIGKLRDSSIISQVVATESWIVGDANPRITSGAATSFRQIGNGDLKPDTIYTFESNKPITQATIGSFDPAKLNRNTTYFKAQTFFTNYDSKGNLSEVKSLVTGLSNAVMTDYDQQYAVAKISNAKQADIAYTSFESVGTGNWTVASTARDLTYNLSGKKSYNLSNGNVSKSGLTSSVHYLLTLWVRSGASVSVNSSAVSNPIATQNSWSLYSIALTGITSVTISGSGLIDEVRLHPKDANMQTYTFEPLIGMTSTVDANNGVLYNEYDKLNRIKLIRDKDKNIVKRFDYSDTTMLVNRNPVWVGFDKGCSSSTPGGVDSLYKDVNLFSDSSGFVKKVYQGYLDCSCPEIASNPQYKVVNGVCEMGTWGVTSSVYQKVLVDGFLQWRWVCTYRYCFSDDSQSTYYQQTINTSPCSLSCVSL